MNYANLIFFKKKFIHMEELVKLAQKSESEVSKLNPRFIKNS